MNTNEKRRITAEDLYNFEIITASEISPEGNKIVYAVQSVEKETEKKHTHLWLVDLESDQVKQLTFGKHSNSFPKWSPDGSWIAFFSNRQNEKQVQLFILPSQGGEAFPLTDFQGDFGEYSWSPDSNQIVFQFRQYDQEDVDLLKDDKKKDLGRISRWVDNRVFFKLDGYGYLPRGRYHLWTVDIHCKEPRQITDTDLYDEENPIWSPDGKSIAFLSNRSPHPDLQPDLVDLFLMDLSTGDMQKVATQMGPKFKISFSPDGQKIAYIGHEGLNLDFKNNELWIVNLEQNESARSLTAPFDFDAGGGVINDIGSVITNSPAWSADGKSLYFQVGRHGRTSLHKISVDGEDLETVLEFDGVVSGFSTDNSRSKIAFIQGTMADPCQISLFEIGKKAPKQLTALNKQILDQLDLGTCEEVWFKGPDKNDLQGWILKPPGFDPTKKYPSIMEIHGGPLAQYGFFFMHEFYYLAAQGYVVYFSNPRGGQGYGEEHAGAIHGGKWGTVDYDDLMAWADFMETQAYIDNHNMGVTGGSYGGYMTVWIIGHTDRFKAAVTQRCVSNLISMWGSSDFNWSFQDWFGGKTPYEDIETLWQCSPMKHIGSAKTPTLVIHSMQDLRCAIEQSEQVFVALKKLGVDTAFLMFPDSPHGLSRTGRTDRKIARLEGILDWFDRYLEK